MDQVLNIEQAIYRNKIEGMNEIMDKNLQEVELKYLNEEYLYKCFKEKLEQKAKVKGRKITSTKIFNTFVCQRWPKMEDLVDH